MTLCTERCNYLFKYAKNKLPKVYNIEQYPPHAPPPPYPSSLFDNFTPLFWLSLSHSPGVWMIFSTSSSKAHCTPSHVFALASGEETQKN